MNNILPLLRYLSLATVLLALGSGCRGVPEYKELSTERGYQEIANLLPELNLGVAEAPGVIRMARSSKIPPMPTAKELVVTANEKEFTLRANTLVPRCYVIPYEAIEDIDFVYRSFPNLIYCFLFPFIQSWQTRLVIDTTFVPKLKENLIADISRLRSIAKEIGIPQPYYYAEELERRLTETKAEWGANRVELFIGRTRLCPPFIPYAGSNKEVAELFLWAREQLLRNKETKN
jgi:hypothetical protein